MHFLASLLGINWATPFLLMALYGFIRYFARTDTSQKNTVNWTPAESIGITLAVYFASQFVGALLAYAIPLLNGWSIDRTSNWFDKNAYGQFILILVIEALTMLLLYIFIKRRGASFKTLGFKKPRWIDLAYVLLGFLIYFGGYLLVLTIVKQIVPSLNTNQPQQIGFNDAGHAQLPFVFVALVILPPLVEETLVRGFLYSGLKKGLPLILAVLVTSALFATAHLQAGSGQPLLWSAAIDTFTLSLVLIFLKEKTGSLTASIGLHMLKNFIAFLGLFVFHLV